MTPKQSLVNVWLEKARHDMAAARILAQHSELLDTAIFHCQQAVEKAIKALLVQHDRLIEKTHNLEDLISANQAAIPALSRWQGRAGELTPYAIRFRYPGDLLSPTRADIEEALRLAEEILQAIEQLIPE